METCGQIFYARLATQTTSLQGYSTAALLSWLVLTTAPSRATFSEIERNTGINTGIPVVVFSNTEILVLPNVVGIGGPSWYAVKKASILAKIVHYLSRANS